MKNKKQATIDTYNDNALSFAEKFDSLGARISDIEEAFALIKKKNPKVLEIGCGNGRDAVEILKRTDNYIGFDASKELIELARQKVPLATFTVADAESFEYPADLDIVFAFASLLHVSREDLGSIIGVLSLKLNDGGIIRISLKYSPHYEEVWQEDGWGKRCFYLYSQEDVANFSKNFTVLKNEIVERKDRQWLEVIFQKKS